MSTSNDRVADRRKIALSLVKRAGSIAVGTAFALLIAEAGLRTAGGLLSWRQSVRNWREIQKEGTYRILCLGESTTQEQWPPLLEEALNSRGLGVKFKVIDLGMSGTYSGVILSRLNKHLDIHNPHMVVVMMGINDGEWVWKDAAAYDESLRMKSRLFLRNIRLNKLARYIADGLRRKNTPEESAPARDLSHTPSSSAPPSSAVECVERGDALSQRGSMEEAEKMYAQALRYSQDDWVFLKLVYHFRNRGQYDKAHALLETAIARNPKNVWFYLETGYLHRDKGQKDMERRMYETAIRVAPNNGEPYYALGKFYRTEGNQSKADGLFETAEKNRLLDAWSYIDLGFIYRADGRRDQEENAFRTALKIDPRNTMAYLELAYTHHAGGNIEKARDVLRQGLAAAGDVPRLKSALSSLDTQRGGSAFSRMRPMTELPPGTIANYRGIRDVISRRGIKLVSMQYPLRDAAVLREALGTDRGIIYVENRENFLRALQTRKRTDLFKDMFAGDFGHCTEAGNRLIAENLSKTILRDVFLIRPPDTHG